MRRLCLPSGSWIFVPEAPASVTRAFAEPASYATNELFTTPLESVVSPSFFNWLRLTASLSCDASATLVIWRLIDALPTEMVFARLAVELAPSATAPVAVAVVLAPIASDWAALAEALSPSAIAEVLNARAFEPIATLFSDADAFAPDARLSEPANVPLPIATPEPSPSAPLPIATAPVFEALGPVSGGCNGTRADRDAIGDVGDRVLTDGRCVRAGRRPFGHGCIRRCAGQFQAADCNLQRGSRSRSPSSRACSCCAPFPARRRRPMSLSTRSTQTCMSCSYYC